MKRICILLCFLLLLCGCSGKNQQMDRAMDLRAKLLAKGVSFDAQITADYGDKNYTFTMNCLLDTQGNLNFQVVEPEIISGVIGTVSANNFTATLSINPGLECNAVGIFWIKYSYSPSVKKIANCLLWPSKSFI